MKKSPYSKCVDKITAIQIWPGEGKRQVLPGNYIDHHIKLAFTQAEFPKAGQRNWVEIVLKDSAAMPEKAGRREKRK